MDGQVTGGVRWLLRLEGLALLVAASFAYAHYGLGWSTFFWFFLVPDISFAGYLAGPRWGAIAYNVAHSTVGGLVTLFAGVIFGAQVGVAAGLIWLAHVGFDRALGYGLKYRQGFRFTHLGLIGRDHSTS